MKLNLDKQESDFLNNSIKHWENERLIDAGVAEKLRNSYQVKGFDWMRLAKYSFWIALFCGAIAVGSLVIDERLLAWLKSLYYTPDIVISIISGIIAAISFYFGSQWQRKFPEKVFSNEAIIFIGVLFTASCIAFMGKAIDNHSGHFSLLFLLSVFVYGVLAYRMRSSMIWLFALVSLGSWFGTETGYQTRWSYYFLGLNYPLRFVLFSMILVAACFILKNKRWFGFFWELTYVIGLLYLFISLWLLSIFGNYGSIDYWWHIKQISFFYWGIISAVVAGGFLMFGLRAKDAIAREFGITFLLVYIYTQYFEYFWDHTNKTLFFSILGASFWLIGRKAERIWNFSNKRQAVD